MIDFQGSEHRSVEGSGSEEEEVAESELVFSHVWLDKKALSIVFYNRAEKRSQVKMFWTKITSTETVVRFLFALTLTRIKPSVRFLYLEPPIESSYTANSC